MSKISSTLTVQNKKYTYSLEQKEGGVVHVVCADAKIDQDFLSADVANLIIDLPNLILAEKTYRAGQTDILRFRVSPSDKKRIAIKAEKAGFESVSDYLRHTALA
jgi:hypothetical protein